MGTFFKMTNVHITKCFRYIFLYIEFFFYFISFFYAVSHAVVLEKANCDDYSMSEVIKKRRKRNSGRKINYSRFTKASSPCFHFSLKLRHTKRRRAEDEPSLCRDSNVFLECAPRL